MRLTKSIRQDVRLAKSKWCDLNKSLLDSLVGENSLPCLQRFQHITPVRIVPGIHKHQLHIRVLKHLAGISGEGAEPEFLRHRPRVHWPRSGDDLKLCSQLLQV